MAAQSSDPSRAGMVAYISCAEDRRILVFGLDPSSGALQLEQTVSVPGTEEASPSNMPLAVRPDHRVLYAALRAPPYVTSCFGITPGSGHLAWRSSSPLADAMAYIATDRDGRHLLCASYRGGSFTVYRLAQDGDIDPQPTARIEGQPKAHCIIPARRTGIVYGTVLAHDVVLPLAFDPVRGSLNLPATPARKSAPGSGPRHLALHPGLDVLYIVNEHAGTLDVCRVEPGTGLLQQQESHSLVPTGFSGNARAADLHVTPDGAGVYASVRSTGSIAGFRVDPASGGLRPVGTWSVCGSPRGFNITPNSRFLLVAGQADNVLDVFRIAPEHGVLTQIGSYRTPGNPNWVEIIDRGSGSEQ